MRKINALVGALLTIVSIQACAQRSLIPRADFFEGEERFDMKLDSKGEHFYYLSSNLSTAILKGDVSNGLVTDTLKYGQPVVRFEILVDKPVVLCSGTHVELYVGDSQLEIPEDLSGLRLVLMPYAKRNLFVELNHKEGQLDGYYQIDYHDERMVKVADLADYERVFFTPEGKLVAAASFDEVDDLVFEFARGEEIVEFCRHPWDITMIRGGLLRILSITENGQYIYYTSNQSCDKAHLYRLDVETEETKLLASDEKCDIIPYGLSYTSEGDVAAVIGLYAAVRRHCLLDDWKRDFDTLSKIIGEEYYFLQSVSNDTKWLVKRLDGGPNEYLVFDRKTAEVFSLGLDYPRLDDELISTRSAHVVTAIDGLELPLHVYLPEGSDPDGDGIPNSPLPTVLYNHGGPWFGLHHWNRVEHWRHFQLLANRGYAVINSEFRGSTGLGKDFIQRSYKEWGHDMVQDNVDVAHWAVAQGIADIDRIGIWGWSYGGYSSLAAMTYSPGIFACAMSLYGPVDLVYQATHTFPSSTFMPVSVGDVHDPQDSLLLIQYSPLSSANRIEGRVLINTGALDTRVPMYHADTMHTVMEELGKDHLYFYYANEGHDFKNKESWMSFWSIAEVFLADNLSGRFEPPGDDDACEDLVFIRTDYSDELGLRLPE